MTASSTYIHGINEGEQIRLSILNELLNKKCLEKISLHTGSKVLDVGSGLGLMTQALSSLAGAEGYCLGIERSPEQLAKAKQLEHKNLCFRLGNAQDLPLLENEIGTFDLVYARFILEHLPDPIKAIKEMKRALRPGGKLILADDDHQAMILYPEPDGFQQLWTAYVDSFIEIGNDPFIGRKLPRLLHEAGFGEVQNDMAFFGDTAGSESFTHYVKNLSEVIATAKSVMLEANLISLAEFEKASDQLLKWSELKYATAYYPLCIATGTKNFE